MRHLRVPPAPGPGAPASYTCVSLCAVRLTGRRVGGDVAYTTQGLTSLPQGGLARSSSRGSVAASSDLDALFDDKPPSRVRSPSPERTSPPPAITKRPPLPHKGGAKVRLYSSSLLVHPSTGARIYTVQRMSTIYTALKSHAHVVSVRSHASAHLSPLSLPPQAGIQAASLRGGVPHRARLAVVRGWQRRRQRRRAQGQVAHVVHPCLRLLRCALTPRSENTLTHTHSSESHLLPFARYHSSSLALAVSAET